MNKRVDFRHTTLALGVAAALVLPAGALAQGMVLEEVIVTAQKRAETSQEVPISIAAFSQEAIEKRRFTNIEDMIGAAPGVGGFTSPGSRGAVGLNIRGVSGGSPANLSLDPGVAMYQDGVYIGKTAGSAFDMVELERIEILRGPQGTLYGRNATGGAVNFITRKPTGEFGARVTGSLGNYGYQALKANVDLPGIGQVGEGAGRLAASVGGQLRLRDGTFDNETPGADDFNDIDRQGYRLAVNWSLTDSFSADYAYDHSELDEIQNLEQVVSFTPINAAGDSRIDALHNTLAAAQGWLSNPNVDPRIASRFIPSLERTIAAYEGAVARGDGPDDSRSEFEPTAEDEVDGHTLALTLDAGDLGALGEVEFKSITGYREMETYVYGDLEDIDTTMDSNGVGAMNDVVLTQVFGRFYGLANGASSGLINSLWNEIDAEGGAFHSKQDTTSEYEQFSQELQMVGTTETLEYAFGAYYFEDEGHYDRYALFLVPVGGNSAQFYDNDTEAWATFGQVTWTPGWLDDRLSFTGGLRYTEEEKGIDYDYTASTQTLRPAPARTSSLDEDFDNTSGNVTVAYDLTDDANVFLRYATGYRSGGFNGEAFNSAFDEETIEQWELGLKSDWWDRRLRLNASLYTYTFEDMQVSQILTSGGTATTLITNAGEAERWGGEIEMLVSPVEDLVLGLSYSHIDGDFDEFPDTCGTAQPIVCFNGEDYAKRASSPDNMVSGSIDYVIARTEIGEVTAFVQANWQDEWAESALWTAVDGGGNPLIYPHNMPDERTLVNARLSLENIAAGDGNVRVSLWANNLLDEEYSTYSINFGSLGMVTEHYGDPRMYGVDVTYEY